VLKVNGPFYNGLFFWNNLPVVLKLLALGFAKDLCVAFYVKFFALT
jgi:hypothetical protein